MREPVKHRVKIKSRIGKVKHTISHNSDASSHTRRPATQNFTDASFVFDRDIQPFRSTPDMRVVGTGIAHLKVSQKEPWSAEIVRLTVGV